MGNPSKSRVFFFTTTVSKSSTPKIHKFIRCWLMLGWRSLHHPLCCVAIGSYSCNYVCKISVLNSCRKYWTFWQVRVWGKLGKKANSDWSGNAKERICMLYFFVASDLITQRSTHAFRMSHISTHNLAKEKSGALKARREKLAFDPCRCWAMAFRRKAELGALRLSRELLLTNFICSIDYAWIDVKSDCRK